MLEFGQSPADLPEDLVERLTQLQLCRLADFRRARFCVRRLARDLPLFDSVWIDALVQRRILTPFQARWIESGAAHRLRMGEYVVVNELGQGPHGSTLLSKVVDGRELRVLKRLKRPAEMIPDCESRLLKLLERSREWSHSHLELPFALFRDGDSIVTVSRWVPGLTLAELLVRRGRFSADVVLDIGRQLAAGLAALHRLGLAHGDIRLANIRLGTRGNAVLVDGGIRPAVSPETTIHDAIALDACDGLAPELIGTGQTVNAASEMYALGCLLWQMLAGRPPYWMADPLMKLAAHQSQRIPDVRSIAPDTPALLADAIALMTSPDANQRPRAFDDLLNRWGRPGLGSRWRLKDFRLRFDGTVPHLAQAVQKHSGSRWPLAAASLFVVSGMAVTLADSGLRNEILAIPRRFTYAVRNSSLTSQAGDSGTASNNPGVGLQTEGALLPLPPPSADGVVLLAEPGPYDAARVASAGQITIRGQAGQHPVIRIGREALWVSGSKIRLENVAIVADDKGHDSPAALVLAKSQSLQIDRCTFRRPRSADQKEPGQHVTMVAWRPIESDGSVSECDVTVSNSILQGPGASVWTAEMPRKVVLENCLKIGEGACLAVSPKAAAHSSTVELNKLTLRESGPFLRLAGPFAEDSGAPTIQVDATNCLFAGRAGTSLVELQTRQPRSDAAKAVRFSGEGTVIVAGIDLTAVVDPASGSSRTTIEADEQFEGIVISELQFEGPADELPDHSRLRNLTAPRSSAAPRPGVQVDRLPEATSEMDAPEIRSAARPSERPN